MSMVCDNLSSPVDEEVRALRDSAAFRAYWYKYHAAPQIRALEHYIV